MNSDEFFALWPGTESVHGNYPWPENTDEYEAYNDWAKAVVDGYTLLGFRDWLETNDIFNEEVEDD